MPGSVQEWSQLIHNEPHLILRAFCKLTKTYKIYVKFEKDCLRSAIPAFPTKLGDFGVSHDQIHNICLDSKHMWVMRQITIRHKIPLDCLSRNVEINQMQIYCSYCSFCWILLSQFTTSHSGFPFLCYCEYTKSICAKYLNGSLLL